MIFNRFLSHLLEQVLLKCFYRRLKLMIFIIPIHYAQVI